jgi:DNA invertase Pin-like site-specific DNA recombinase
MNDHRVLGYCRASTKRQVDSPETQRQHIKHYAELNQLGEPAYFVDSSKSGKIAWDERDAGRELFSQVRPGDHVIIAKLDRAFRRLADCVQVLEKFERMGVKIHICNLMGGAIDLSSPMGRFFIHVLAAFAELERAFISERTKDGLARKRRAGVAHARHPGYGFKWKKLWVGGKLVKVREPEDDERSVMRLIVQWRMQDSRLSWHEIAAQLTDQLKLKTKDDGVWDVNRVRRACEAELRLQGLEQHTDR